MNRARTTERVKYLRQSISLSGFGTTLFEATIEGLANFFALLARPIPPSRLTTNTVIDMLNGKPSINLSNRYFTPKKDAPMSNCVPFPNQVDPHGVLTAMIGDRYIHTEDNVVKYFNRVAEPDGHYRYIIHDNRE